MPPRFFYSDISAEKIRRELMNIIAYIWPAWIAAIFLLFVHCSDDDPRDGDVMLEEISSHQNVVP